MKKIRVGLIGFGTVGSGVVDVIRRRHGDLAKKTGVDIAIVRICDKDLKRKRPVKADLKILTRDAGRILYDPNIDLVIELIGGIRPAKDIILEAIRQGKHVVTANKALLAEAGEEIFDLAASCGVSVGFEASVGGGIPIIRALKEGLVGNKLDLIYGIINGTSNFILTSMEEAGGGFEDALELAKKKGYAEKDPTLDINGADSSHKLAILARLGFGLAARPKEIYTEGIIDIDPLDIQYARELGYAIRLLAIAKRSGAELELRVHPTLIAKDHPLANVRGVYNAIFLKGDLVGELLFYGQGAGRLPAASSVVSDIICIARSTAKGIPALESSGSAAGWCRKLSDIDRTMSRYYIRFSAIDRPGVLKKIAGILAGRKISIASVTQKEKRSQRIVPIVMMTHAAQERAMAAAVREIDHLSVIKKKSVKIRIED